MSIPKVNIFAQMWPSYADDIRVAERKLGATIKELWEMA